MGRPFTFYLDWVASAQFAGLYWALENGLYERADLSVTLVPWHEGGLSPFDSVAQAATVGTLSAGCAEDNLIVKQASIDRTVLAFGTMLQGTPLVVMSRPDRAIRKISDLRGKRVGMHADGIRALETVLALEEIPVADVDLHEVGFDLEVLLNDQFDALQGYVMTEPVHLAALGFDVDVMSISHPRLHPYAQVYFTDRRLLEQHGGVFADFLGASSAGWAAVEADPDAAAELLAQTLHDASLPGEHRSTLRRLIPLITAGLPSDRTGTIDAEQWTRNLATYYEFGLTDRRLELPDVVCTLPPQLSQNTI